MKNKFDKLWIQRELARENLTVKLKQQQQVELRYENALKARIILQAVAEATQRNIENQLSKMVTRALKAVFPEPYEFCVRFVSRRNKTECDLVLVRNGEEISPVDAVGGGCLDVISFALRIGFWALRKTRPLFLLDEPFKFVSYDYRPAVGEMLQKLSNKLGLQFIMVSHLTELLDYADNIVETQ